MLEIRNLCAGYPGKVILPNFSAGIPEGQITVLLGPNGCGKSTLLKSICGILPAKGGQILLQGQDLRQLPPRDLARTVAYLSQSRRVPEITVRQLVLHGRFPYLGYPRKYRKIDHQITDAALEKMHLSHLADASLSSLSGGQRQKVYIAMALAQDTPVVLLDEPTTYLDVRHQLQIMEEARQLRSAEKTVVMVLHDLNQALQIADRVILMDRGSLVIQGTAEEVYACGKLDSVFGVGVRRMLTDYGWQYYWEGEKP